MRGYGAIALTLGVTLLLVGCGAEASTVTSATSSAESSATAEPSATSAASATPAPSPSTDGPIDVSAQLRNQDESVQSVEADGTGAVNVETNLPSDPASGGDAAVRAIALCERAVALGASTVIITDVDGNLLVGYGGAEYGDLCTEPGLPEER